jgi:outer membrane lipopolysaccharide assembly protein LptE/RlpB
MRKIITTALAALALTVGVAACGGHSRDYQIGFQVGYGTAQQTALMGTTCTELLNHSGLQYEDTDHGGSPDQWNAGFQAGCKSAGGDH